MDDTGAILKGIYHEFEVAEHNNGMHAVIIVQHALARTFKYNLPPLPKKTLVIKKESAKKMVPKTKEEEEEERKARVEALKADFKASANETHTATQATGITAEEYSHEKQQILDASLYNAANRKQIVQLLNSGILADFVHRLCSSRNVQSNVQASIVAAVAMDFDARLSEQEKDLLGHAVADADIPDAARAILVDAMVDHSNVADRPPLPPPEKPTTAPKEAATKTQTAAAPKPKTTTTTNGQSATAVQSTGTKRKATKPPSAHESKETESGDEPEITDRPATKQQRLRLIGPKKTFALAPEAAKSKLVEGGKANALEEPVNREDASDARDISQAPAGEAAGEAALPATVGASGISFSGFESIEAVQARERELADARAEILKDIDDGAKGKEKKRGADDDAEWNKQKKSKK